MMQVGVRKIQRSFAEQRSGTLSDQQTLMVLGKDRSL